MIFPSSQLETIIIERLKTGFLLKLDLVTEIQKNFKFSKESIYKSLRSLKKKKITFEINSYVGLSFFWINEVHNFSKSTQEIYANYNIK